MALTSLLNSLEPLGIAAVPNVVLEIVLEGQLIVTESATGTV